MDTCAQNPLEILIEGEDVADGFGRVLVACAVNGVPFDEDQQIDLINGFAPTISPEQMEVIKSLQVSIN